MSKHVDGKTLKENTQVKIQFAVRRHVYETEIADASV